MQALINHQKDCILDEDEDGNTPLHLACYHGHHRAVNVFLENEADYDAKLALIIAIIITIISIHVVFDKIENMLFRNAVLWSPLDAAACRGHTKVVQVLIDAGADVTPRTSNRPRPFTMPPKRDTCMWSRYC